MSEPEPLAFSSIPSGNHKGKKHIIIVGAGIIGVCTAFFLTRHPNFDKSKYHITILESKRVAGGASGKAGGLLALWAFPQQIVPLSFKLHQDLANEFGGGEIWGYRRLTTLSIEGDISDKALEAVKGKEGATSSKSSLSTMKLSSNKKESHNATSSDPSNSPASSSSKRRSINKNSIEMDHGNATVPGAPSLPQGLDWINQASVSEWNCLGDQSTTAQVHPYKFTTFILKKCLESEAVELVIGKVDDLLFDEETAECTGVSFSPSSTKHAYSEAGIAKSDLYGDKIVLTMGPWTSKILPDCPISGLRAHSITVKVDEEQKHEISPFAIFTELRMNRNKFVSPEMYARKDEIYVCGEGDTSVPIPETTDDVEIVTEKCDELFKTVGKLSDVLKSGKILKRQACYLPVLDVPSSSGPLIGESNVESLYIASGHSCWGINNAPATGQLMSELLLEGKAHSCDISALDPSLYFDASLLYESDASSEMVSSAVDDDESSSEDEVSE